MLIGAVKICLKKTVLKQGRKVQYAYLISPYVQIFAVAAMHMGNKDADWTNVESPWGCNGIMWFSVDASVVKA